MSKIIFGLLIFFNSKALFACIFQSENVSGSPVFWTSKSIPVCFLPANPQKHISAANPLDDEYMRNYIRNKEVIKKTVESQINGRTSFRLTGFGDCPSPDTGEKIRIDLNGAGGGNGAIASSVGPKSSLESPNLTVTVVNSASVKLPGYCKIRGEQREARFVQLPPECSRDPVRKFNSAEEISWASLHEILHLLGLHHTEYWNQDISKATPDIKSVTQLGTYPDSKSIMSRGFRGLDSSGIAQLSNRDVACLNMIANKTILQLPSRAATEVTLPQEAPIYNQNSSGAF